MEPVTKADLDALRNEITDLRDELTGHMRGMENTFRNEMRVTESALRNDLTEQMRGIETTLLKEFRKWAVPMNTRTRTFEVTSQGLTERRSMVEERLGALETR